MSIVGFPVDAVTSRVANLFRTAPKRVFFVTSDGASLQGLSKMIEEGSMVPVTEKTYPLVELALAHRMVETGRVAGKVCVDVLRVESYPRFVSVGRHVVVYRVRLGRAFNSWRFPHRNIVGCPGANQRIPLFFPDLGGAPTRMKRHRLPQDTRKAVSVGPTGTPCT